MDGKLLRTLQGCIVGYCFDVKIIVKFIVPMQSNSKMNYLLI